ncbi:NADPH-dependent FMN reductase [Aureimonas sp. AU4]|uniref:NADPH-dependent FMN reductase n=1 Tax=Aureimonas sp. AU4 TaxID=1638163 RepID=UPI0007863251|nr:NAD(P)H-dependent oxidoreductase [Aureimonas sp. AU4]
MSPRILIMAASARSGSPETQLAGEAMRRLAVTDAVLAQVHAADYPLPVFDGLEGDEAAPQNARLLAGRLTLQDGLVLVTPARCAGAPALLVNQLEWIAASGGEAAFRRLVVALAVVGDPGDAALCAQELRTRLARLGASVVTPTFPVAAEDTTLDREADGALDGWLDAFLDHARALGRHG